MGPAAGSWSEVDVRAVGDRTVTFTLTTPLGGFLQAATQPIAPAHLLADVPVDALADHPFGTPAGRVRSVRPGRPDRRRRRASCRSPRPTDGEAETARRRRRATRWRRRARPAAGAPDAVPVRHRDSRSSTTRQRWARRTARATSMPRRGCRRPTPPSSRCEPSSRLLRYPGATLTAVLLNLRPGSSGVRGPGGPHRAPDGDRPADAGRRGLRRAPRRRRPVRSRRARRCSIRRPTRPSPTTARPPGRRFLAAGWVHKDDGWHRTATDKAIELEVLSPDEKSNPVVWAAARQVAANWRQMGFTVTHVGLPAGAFVTDRLAKGDFQVAVADVTIGLDPDLYPLLASSQTVTGGSNVMGVQDPALDKLLVAARAPGTMEARKAAYSKLAGPARQGSLPAPAGLPGRGRRGPRHARRTGPPPGRRRVGPILGCANMAPRRGPLARSRAGPCRGGGMVDALVSGTSDRKVVWVRVPPSVPSFRA